MTKNLGRSISPDSLRQRLINLEVGKEMIIPFTEYRTSNIRTQASMIACEFSQRYKVSVHREGRYTEVKRIN